jgi:hypothetical protein
VKLPAFIFLHDEGLSHMLIRNLLAMGALILLGGGAEAKEDPRILSLKPTTSGVTFSMLL